MAYGMLLTTIVKRVAYGKRISLSALRAAYGVDVDMAVSQGLIVNRPAGRWSRAEVTDKGREYLAGQGV